MKDHIYPALFLQASKQLILEWVIIKLFKINFGVEEKSSFNLFFLGTSIGPILSIVTAGILAKYFGWEAIFYVHGGLACIWLILWAVFISNTPSDNYFISEAEMIYITSNCSYNKNLNNSMVLV